jgi:hypothetical protein
MRIKLLALACAAAAVAASFAVLAAQGPAPLSWLRPRAVPRGWRVATTPSRAMLAYPAGWHEIESDRGTVSAAPRGKRGFFVGYLNATPQSGDETLANWRRVRPAHVAEEGAHRVTVIGSATGLRFRGGRGSCVVESYSTSKMRFREVACIVAGTRTTTVVVAAAPAAGWAREAPALEKAIASFST